MAPSSSSPLDPNALLGYVGTMKFWASFGLCLLISACGGKNGPTELCTEADDCQEGLSCIALQNGAAGQCTGSPGSACTKTCTTDAECNTLEAGLVCLGQCDGLMLCTRLAQ